MSVSLVVNGERLDADVAPDASLLAVLRAGGLTGAKEACGRGECGACTVLVDGEAVMSCIALAALVRGAVTTAEGLDDAGRPVREAFAEHCGHQCGYCTPGHVVNGAALVTGGGALDRGALRRQISGNVCRCTGYAQILDAVEAAAELTR